MVLTAILLEAHPLKRTPETMSGDPVPDLWINPKKGHPTRNQGKKFLRSTPFGQCVCQEFTQTKLSTKIGRIRH